MNILSKEEIGKLRLAKADLAGAGREFVDMCKMFLKPGVVVYWRHNGHLQRGVVVRFCGTADFPDMFVTNIKTGKRVKIFFYDIDWSVMLRQSDVHEVIDG